MLGALESVAVSTGISGGIDWNRWRLRSESSAGLRRNIQSWVRERRVIVKAEVTHHPGGAPRDNPRYVVTNLEGRPEAIYCRIYAPRGDMENRIKEA